MTVPEDHPFRRCLIIQIIGLVSACLVQILFWWLWFKKDLKKFAPVLLLAFILTIVITLLAYNTFVWYVKMVAKDAAIGAVRDVVGIVQDISGAIR